MQTKTLTVEELRTLINEALNEEHHNEVNELAEDAESAAAESAKPVLRAPRPQN